MKFAIYLTAVFTLHAQTKTVPQDPEKARLEGVVLNSVTSEPLRKASLTLLMNVAAVKDQRTAQSPRSIYTVSSDAAGHFEFVNVEPGDYQLAVTRDGFSPLRLGNRGNGRKADPILLSRGDRKTDFRIKLVPYGSISGMVLDEDGDPLRDLHIAAMQYRYTSSGRELREVKGAGSNDLGEFRVYDLPPGRYLVKVNPRQLSINPDAKENSYGGVFYPGVPQVSGAIPQDLLPGQQLRGLSFNLGKIHVPTVRGKVIAPQGATNVSAGYIVVTDNNTSSSSGNVKDEKTGAFELRGIAPGLVYITGSYVLDRQRFDTMVPVEVGSTDIEGLELRPLPPADITGHISVEGDPAFDVSRMVISLEGPSVGHRGTTSPSIARDGRITIPGVLPGRYRVVVSHVPLFYMKSMHWGTTEITDTALDLLAGVPPRTELSIVLAADAGELTGTVKNEESQPVDAAMVTLVPLGAHRSAPFYKLAATDASGGFTIRGIAPGSYKVYAWDQANWNAVVYDPEFLKPHEASGQRLEIVSKGKHSADLRLIINQDADDRSQ